MIIVIYHNNIIERILSCNNDENFEALINNKKFHIFDHTHAFKGLNIKALNHDGSIKSLAEQLELGIISLEDDEIIEHGIIRKLSYIEKIEQGLEPLPQHTEIKIDEQGEKYLAEIVKPTEKTIGELLLEKKAELQIIRQHILNAQADEELDALPNLRIQRDTLKTEILSLEADIE